MKNEFSSYRSVYRVLRNVKTNEYKFQCKPNMDGMEWREGISWNTYETIEDVVNEIKDLISMDEKTNPHYFVAPEEV